jgi:LysR family transcriptional regulator, regulator for metE and metH
MDLELRHLRLLVTVSEEGTLTRAGKRLHATQSALSHQLRDAEERVGEPLFLRRKDRMVPTEAAERLLPVARNVLEELARAQGQQSANGRHRELRISTECYTSYHWLPRALPEFRKRYPEVQVMIDPASTAEPVEALLAGKIDVGILRRTTRRTGVRLEPLFEDEFLLVMAAQHLLAKRRDIHPADLAGQTILAYPPKEECWLARDVLLPLGIAPGKIYEVPLTEGILGLVAAGTGVAYLAKWAVMPYLDSNDVVARSISGSVRRMWTAATLAQTQPAHLRDFISLLRDTLPSKERLRPAI